MIAVECTNVEVETDRDVLENGVLSRTLPPGRRLCIDEGVSCVETKPSPSGAHCTENYQPGWPLACPDYLQYGRRWGLVYRGPKMGNRKRTWTGKEQGRGASAARVSAAIAAMGSPPPGEECGAGDDSPAEDHECQWRWYICCCSRTRLQLLRVCWADQGHLDL
jgi:hypothetical protein